MSQPTPLALDRAATNRANAQNSTGPRTPAGKAKMRFNAVQHGLYSATVVLPYEDLDGFQDFSRRMRRPVRSPE